MRRNDVGRNVLAAYFLYLVVYGSVSLRMGLHWDEVLDFDGSAYGTYMAAGRWLTGAWRALTGSWEPVWIPGFVGGLILSALVCAQAGMLGLGERWKRWAFIIIYFASVQWASMLSFSFLTESVVVGMGCATLSAWLCFKSGWKSAVGAAVLLTIALGAYQTLAMYFGVAWLVLRLLNLRRNPEGYSLKPWARMACIALGGMIMWKGIHILTLPFVSQEDLDYVQQYQGSITQWGDFGKYSVKLQILGVLHYFKYSVLCAIGIGKESYWLFATALVPMSCLLYQSVRHFQKWARWESCVNLLLIWWLPFCTSLLVLTAQPFRAALAAPLSLAGLWALWLMGIQVQQRHIRIMCILGLCVIGTASATVCHKAVTEAKLHHNTIKLLQSIQAEGREYAQTAGCPDAPIVIIPSKADRTAPKCAEFYPVGIFGWYCRAYGIQGVRLGTKQEVAKYRERVMVLPPWPAPGCIVEDQGIIIIVIR